VSINRADPAAPAAIWRPFVLARTGTLRHPFGALIDLPRLVPAFSSKGFPFLPSSNVTAKTGSARQGKRKSRSKPGVRRANRISEATKALETNAPFIKDSILVSAYDLFHAHFRRPQRFFGEKELIFIDSGGYELGPSLDVTEPVHLYTPTKKFSCANYLTVLKGLSDDVPFAVANFDHDSRQKPLLKQILAGQKLFDQFPRFLKDFIVKPVGNERYVNVEEIIRHIRKFQAFDILGLTEKDLGKDLVDKLKALAKLRLAMDRENLTMPIHVWGGLDPLRTPLYFFAGAEIFDGISWLRYVYIDGVAVYRDSYSVLLEGIETPNDHAVALAISHNLGFLRGLATNLRDFVLHGALRFDMFGSRATVLEKAYRSLVTQVPAIGGGK
jgi:hypothetical protein